MSSIKITVAFCVILFVGYVLVLWGFGAIVAPNQGEAELVTINGKVVGATQVGQSFTGEIYFWGRPSAVDHNGNGSGGSNKGPTNPDYLNEVLQRSDSFLQAHPHLLREQIPSEMITASGSGLDPHISPEAAQVQIKRVALARGMAELDIEKLVASHTVIPWVGVPYINILKLNATLDENKNN